VIADNIKIVGLGLAPQDHGTAQVGLSLTACGLLNVTARAHN